MRFTSINNQFTSRMFCIKMYIKFIVQSILNQLDTLGDKSRHHNTINSNDYSQSCFVPSNLMILRA